MCSRPLAGRRAGHTARIVLSLVAASLFAGACSDGDDDNSSPTSRAPVAAPELNLELAAPHVFGVADGAVLPKGVGTAVLAAANRFVADGMLGPLVGNEPSQRFSRLFALDVQPLVGPDGRDRPALTDDGVPVATASPTVATSPVELDVLVAADGAPVVAVAAFRARTNAGTDQGPIQIGRTIELTFEPGGDGWFITAYRVNATRKGLEPEPTTTTAASAGDG
jgi:hypothetical protein